MLLIAQCSEWRARALLRSTQAVLISAGAYRSAKEAEYAERKYCGAMAITTICGKMRCDEVRRWYSAGVGEQARISRSEITAHVRSHGSKEPFEASHRREIRGKICCAVRQLPSVAV